MGLYDRLDLYKDTVIDDDALAKQFAALPAYTPPPPPPQPETGYLKGTAQAIGRGIAGVAEFTGDALQDNTEYALTGDKSKLGIVNIAGQKLSDAAAGVKEYIGQPNAGGNGLKQAVFEGVESIPVSVSLQAPGVAAAYGGRVLGGAMGTVGGPVGIAGGALAGGAGAAALAQTAMSTVMHKATRQQTLEELDKLQAAGKLRDDVTPEQKLQAAEEAARAEWQGELPSSIVESLIYSRLPAGKTLQTLLRPGIKQFAKNMAMSAPLELGGEAYTAHEQTKAVNSLLKPENQQSATDAAVHSLGPTSVMTTIMAGMGVGGQRLAMRNLATNLENAQAPELDRYKAATQVAELLKRDHSPEAAANFLEHAADAIGDTEQTGSNPYGLDLADPALLLPKSYETVSDNAQQVSATPGQQADTSTGAAGASPAPGGAVDMGDIPAFGQPTVARDSVPAISGGNQYQQFAEQPFSNAPAQPAIAGVGVEGMLNSLQPVDANGSKNSLASAVLAGGKNQYQQFAEQPFANAPAQPSIAGPAVEGMLDNLQPATPSERFQALQWAQQQMNDPALSKFERQNLVAMMKSTDPDKKDLVKHWASFTGQKKQPKALPIAGGAQQIAIQQGALQGNDLQPGKTTKVAAAPTTPGGVGKTVSPARKRDRSVKPTQDDLITAIGKLGGINRDQAVSQWGNSIKDSITDLNRHASREGKAGILHVVSNKGKDLDSMREALEEHGYLPQGSSIEDMYSKIDQHFTGKPSYSNQHHGQVEEQDLSQAPEGVEASEYPFDLDGINFSEKDKKHLKFLQRMLKNAKTSKTKEQARKALQRFAEKNKQETGSVSENSPAPTIAHDQKTSESDKTQQYLDTVGNHFQEKFKDAIFKIDEEDQKQRVMEGRYAIDRIPQEMERSTLQGTIGAAARIAAGSHQADAGNDVITPADKRARGKLESLLKSQEKKALIAWAKQHDLLIDPAEFTKQWDAQGNVAGAEHHVYITKDQRVIKRSLSPNATWLQYMQRLAMHNYLFRDVPYTLKGFMVDKGQLFAVVEQPFVETDKNNPATTEEVAKLVNSWGYATRKNKEMVTLGLVDTKYDEYLNDQGVLIDDLHDKNAFRTYGGNIAIIDAIIKMDPDTKRERLMQRYGLQEQEPAQRNTAKHKAFLKQMMKNAKTTAARAKIQQGLAKLEARSKPIPVTIDDEINSMSLDDMAALFSQAAAEAVAPAPVRNRAKMQESLRKKLAKQLAKTNDAREQKRLQQSLEKLQALQAKLSAENQPAEQTGRPDKDNGAESYFKKGDRVQFANGVHGTISKVESYTAQTALLDIDGNGIGIKKLTEERNHSYTVRKDNGVEAHGYFSNMEKETDPAPEVIPAPSYNGTSYDPDTLLSKIKSTRKSADDSRDAASRSRKADKVDNLKQAADRYSKEADELQAAFDTWAKQYPEEAAKFQPVAAPSPDPAAAGTAVAGVRVTYNAAQNGIELRFAGKPDADLLAKIKANGFHWAMGKKIWYAKDTPSRRAFAEGLQGKKASGIDWNLKAAEVGRQAFENGESATPAKSSALNMLIKQAADAGEGNALQIIDAFAKAWHSANLEKPVEEKTIWNDDGTNGPVAITAPPSTRSASDILGAAASSGVKGADEALKGLYELFGGKSLKSFPGAVDEATYKAAKPHFEAALENFRAAGKSLKEFFSFLIDQFGAGIQPYVMKYMQEKQQESGILEVTNQEAADNDNTTDGGTGKGSLESSVTGTVPDPAGKREAGEGSGSISGTDDEGDGNTDEGGHVRSGSVASQPESVHLQPGEGAEGSAVLPSGATGSVSTPSEPRTPKLSGDNPGNYRITAADDLGGGTRGQKIDANLAAIRLVKQLDKEGRYPTRAEQAVLVKYVGWGGLKSVFDPNSTKPQDQKARTELEQLLTDAEYFEARQSVLNAHYTSPEIIGSIYNILQHMGFKGGNVLEPTYGSGNFIGLMPEQMAAASKWYGSELDPVTSKIGKFLYPDAQLLESGFQDAEFPYGKFDLAIGNPPFGSEQITDTNKKRSEIDRFKIHNYVIAKSGMHLRPGGVMAMVVTSRFMDTANPEARDYLAKQFKFLTAIRLPNDAFVKNAGTEVTTDLVFFQKLMPGESADLNADWLNVNGHMVNASGEDIYLNEWFASYPHLMLGEPSMKGTMYGGQWRKEDGKGEFTLNARPGQDTAAELYNLMHRDKDHYSFELLRDVFKPTPAKADAAAISLEMNREDVGIGGYVEENGTIFMREDDDQNGNPVFVKLAADTPWTEKQTLGETRLNRIKGMLELRKAAYALIEAERFDMSDMESKRQRLNQLYDAFVAKHGFLSDTANASLMADDVKIESGLEVNYRKAITAAKAKTLGVKPQPAKADKAAIMQQRVFFPVKEITSAANARDGYGISLSEKGRLDLAYIAGLTGQTSDEVTKELADEGLIFKDPATGAWQQEDEYLSGNVKAKLQKVLGREGFEKNVEALTAVLPKDVTPEEIFADLGATWIPAEVYKEFADLMGVTNANVLVIPETGTVKIISGGHVQNDMNVMLQNPDHDVASLINHIAAKQAVVAYDPVDDGNGGTKRVVNKERTKALVPMVKRVSATFRDWLMADPRRATELTKLYNDTMNTHAPRTYNGKHLKTVGASPAVRLRNSQRNAAWRMLQSPVVLLDHVVGAGKTFTIITGVMERKRLGLSNKSMIVVPNHLVGQWGSDFLKLYPGARILATTEKDFAKANRKRLFARIATGNYDAVIVGHSSFGFIPLEAETQQEFVMEEISHLERALSIAQSAGGNDKRLIRNLTEKIAKKRERIRSLMNKERDDVITFENMGVDNLVVDESHEFKNLEYSTSMQNITGMGNPNGAKKSFDLYAKIQYLRGKDGAITFATGTPISNSLVEMYTILRYLNRQGLKDRNLDVFDAWAKAYASIESRIEYTPSQKLKDRQVMATFNNLPELLQLYSEFADVIGMKDLKRIYAEQIKESNKETGANEREEFPVPKVKNGARYLDVADPTTSQRQYMDYLVARANRLEKLGGQNDPKTDNHLWLMNDARKMALDIRLVDPSAPSDPDNKVNRAANNIKRIYDQWRADKGAQLVFCDLSTPAGSSRSEAAKFIKAGMAVLGLDKDKALANTLKDLSYGEQWTYLKNRIERRIEALSESGTVTEADEDLREKLEKYLDEVDDNDIAALQTLDTGFSVYDDLKATLIDMGIPASEIRFIHEANTRDQKTELFSMVNSGLVRVLIGSSRKMGAGTNAQERLVALHHMDAPWRPSDVEQREGRIIRQGNVLYDRDPDNFEVEIPAYSTRNTFDSVSWQILARKAEMLEDFRSGARSMQDSESDAASYSEFMAESTGNPIFREKFKLEREIEELESTERNIMARRAAGERIVRNADADIAKAEKTLQEALRDMAEVKDAKVFEVDGKKYADDLTEAYTKAYAEYETANKEYTEKLLPEYVAAMQQLEEQELDDKAKKEAKKLIKKPVEPAKPTLPRLEKTSQAARAALRVSELLDDVAERGEVEFAFGGSQVVIEKVPVGAEYFNFKTFINGKERWGLSANGLKHMSQQKLMELFNTGEIASRVAADLRVARAAVESVKQSIADAERTLSKLKFEDADKLKAMQDRYKAVVEEVNQLEKDMDQKREQEANIYISGDSNRFGGAEGDLYSANSENGSLFTSGLESDTIIDKPVSKINGITIVSAKVLRDKELQPVEVQGETSDMLRAVADRFGLKVIFYRPQQLHADGNGDKRAGAGRSHSADGFITGADKKTIFLNVNSGRHLQFIIGHEISHALDLNNEKAYQQLLVDLFPYLNKEKVAEYEEFLKTNPVYSKLDTFGAYKEVVADALGELFVSKNGWSSLAVEKPTLFSRLADAIIKVLDKIRTLFTNEVKSSAFFTDYAAVNRILLNAVKEYAENNGGMDGLTDATREYFSAASPTDTARAKQLADHLQQQKFGEKTAVMVRSLFDLLESAIPPKLKANMGKILNNPWWGSEGNPIRRAIVNLNLQRSHVRNSLIHGLMKSDGAGYDGIEGLENLLKKGTKQEKEAWNRIIKQGDIDEKWYTNEDLKQAGASKLVTAAYRMFHAIVNKANQVRFATLKDIALLPYKNERWFDELKGIVDLREKLNQGLEPAQKAILTKLLQSLKDNPDLAKLAKKQPQVVAAYKEFMKQLNASSEPHLIRMAYRHINDYHTEIDKIRNEWGFVKGYAPRLRKDGDWHVSVYRVGEADGAETRTKVYMKPVHTEYGAQKLIEQIKADMKGHLKSNFNNSDQYVFEFVRDPATPGELLSDRANNMALETLVNTAFDNAGIFKTKDVDVAAMKRAVLTELSQQIMAQGFSRHGIAREKHLIEGYRDDDYLSVLKEFVSGQSGWLAKIQYATEVTREADTISQANGDDKVWVHSYYKDSMKNATYLDEVAATARSVGAVYYLGFKVSSAILNAFQNYTVGQAELASMMKKSGKKGEPVLLLARAQKDVLRSNLSDEEKTVLDRAIREGTLHAQAVRSMSGLQEQGFGSKWKQFAEAAMTPFSWVEQHVNREPAMLAAYRIFKTTTKGEFDQAAFDQAEKFVNNTHYVMGNENLPELVRMLGPVGKTAYLFQGYVHNYLLWLAKRGRGAEFEAIARSFGAIALLGGMFALPGGDDLDKWLEKWFGVSYKLKFKNWLKQNTRQYGTAGEALEGFINHGLPSVFGVDMSRAIAVNIPFMSDTEKSFGERMGGVWSGLAKKPGMAVSALESGDYYRAIENLVPEFVANPMRAARQYNQGATTLAGKPIFGADGKQMQYGALDVTKKALGFNPLEISEQTELRGHARSLKAHWTDKRDDAIAEIRKAKDSKRILEVMQNFNRNLKQSQAYGLVGLITLESVHRARNVKPDKKQLQWQQAQS